MEKIFDNIPDIISAAASSTLGIIALMVIALSILAYIFFDKAKEIIRISIFVLMFVGAAGLTYSVIQTANKYPNLKLITFDTGWIFVGYFDIELNNWLEGDFVRVLYRSELRHENEPFFFLGDILSVVRERSVVIEDYKQVGLTHQYDCPVLIKTSPEETKKLGDEDYTGVKLPPGHKVVVREVCKGNKPAQTHQAIWLRVADYFEQ